MNATAARKHPRARAKAKKTDPYKPDRQLLLLANRAVKRMAQFCDKNKLGQTPLLKLIPPARWKFDVCAYYRPKTIHLCLEQCARPAGSEMSRNWNWPGGVVDRTPYGVICHELAHHIDRLTGKRKGDYWSEYSAEVRAASREGFLTSYGPGLPHEDAEWFAETMRLFITNQALCYLVRPAAYRVLCERFIPVGSNDWVEELGSGCPQRVLDTIEKKFSKKS